MTCLLYSHGREGETAAGGPVPFTAAAGKTEKTGQAAGMGKT